MTGGGVMTGDVCACRAPGHDADPLDEFWDISTWLTAIVGAIILLLIYGFFADRSTSRRRLV